MNTILYVNQLQSSQINTLITHPEEVLLKNPVTIVGFEVTLNFCIPNRYAQKNPGS
jgi:hypothetical protein